MKRIIALILAVVLMVSGIITANAETILMGDTNRDGTIGAVDVRVVMQIAAKLTTVKPEEIRYYDMNGDKEITSADARTVLQMAAELIPTKQYAEQEISPEEKAASVIRKEFIKLVNEYRAKYGAAELEESDVLTAAANVRAEECLTKFSHTRPSGEPYSSVLQGEFEYSYIKVAENIAWLSTGPHSSVEFDKAFDEQELKELAKSFCDMFMDDTAHKNNIIHPNLQQAGFGIAFSVNKDNKTIKVVCSYLAAQNQPI